VPDALGALIDECWRDRRWVVETDIASCFSAIAHEVHGGGGERNGFTRGWFCPGRDWRLSVVFSCHGLLVEMLMAGPPMSHANSSEGLGLPVGSIAPTRRCCIAAAWGVRSF
jgi:hypothetical protein